MNGEEDSFVLKIAVTMPADIGEAGEFLADVRALEAAGADTIGVEGGGDPAMLGAIAAVTHRVRLRVPAGQSHESLRRLSRGRLVTGAPEGETWRDVAMPPDRASWAAMLHEQEAAGVHGIVVAWDSRLIDLLRNPEPDDRSDLLMSTG